MRLASLLASRAKRRYSKRQKLAALLLGAAAYGVLIPPAMLYLSLMLDEALDIELELWPFNVILAVPLLAIGIAFMLWATWAQWSVGKGTPVPAVPTQKLVVTGPYRYCRNPMLFGLALYYSGLALLASSFSGVALTALIVALFVLYVRLVEEKELEMRFGEKYLRYKERTPFIIPRPCRRAHGH